MDALTLGVAIAVGIVVITIAFFALRPAPKTPPRSCKPMNITPGPGVPPGSLIAVTGASGFIGSHVIRELMRQGYKVRACVRDPTNQKKIAHLKALAEECKGDLTFAAGNLLKPGSYDEAFKGCDGLIHCAAVVANKNSVKNPVRDIVDPSVAGSRNIYDSVNKCPSIKRVVHTSSAAAIQTYDKPNGYVFSEKDWNTWSNYTNQDYYGVGKVMAEEIAHRAAEDCKGAFDVAVINPGIAFGECLTKAHTKASPFFIRQLIYGNTQPDVSLPVVDVADVARAHVEAMKRSEAGGQRFVVVNTTTTFPNIITSLKAIFPQYKFTFKPYGGILFNIAWHTPFVSEFERQVMLKSVDYDNALSKQVLGLDYISLDETLKTTINSMTQWVTPKSRK